MFFKRCLAPHNGLQFKQSIAPTNVRGKLLRASSTARGTGRRGRLWDNLDSDAEASSDLPPPPTPADASSSGSAWGNNADGSRDPSDFTKEPRAGMDGNSYPAPNERAVPVSDLDSAWRPRPDQPYSSAQAASAAADEPASDWKTSSPAKGQEEGATSASQPPSWSADPGASSQQAAWDWSEWGRSDPTFEWGEDVAAWAAPAASQNAANSRGGFQTGGGDGGGGGGEQPAAAWVPREGAEASSPPSGEYRSGARAGFGPDGEGLFPEAGGGPSGQQSGQYKLSDIVLLGKREMERLLPLAPTGGQSDFYQPKTLPERIVVLLGSLGASVVLSKVVVLAGPAFLYPLWSPWIRAGLRNLELYARQFQCVGLWRAEIIEVEIQGWGWGGGLLSPPGSGASVRLVVGDGWAGGARVQLEFPYQPGAELLRRRESAELLVLSRDDAFVTFKVVRELYLPESGLWLAEYPFVDRGAFLDISIAVEQARQGSSGQRGAASDGRSGQQPVWQPAGAAAGQWPAGDEQPLGAVDGQWQAQQQPSLWQDFGPSGRSGPPEDGGGGAGGDAWRGGSGEAEERSGRGGGGDDAVGRVGSMSERSRAGRRWTEKGERDVGDGSGSRWRGGTSGGGGVGESRAPAAAPASAPDGASDPPSGW